MNLLLPVDSRVDDTQGFMILDTTNGNILEFETNESLEFVRKGFRGACAVGGRIYVCNSFSLKIYNIHGSSPENISFELYKQIQYPEWLIGRGANADLHMPYYDEPTNQLYLANSYMDCVDILSLEGKLLDRKFLWEISGYIRNLVNLRDPKGADLCHLNHISRIDDEIILTLGNLNRTNNGALLGFESGEIVLDNLYRPHDGEFYDNQYFIIETIKNRLLVFEGVTGKNDLRLINPQVVDLSHDLPEDENNRFWARGLHIDKENIFVACSQFQDRENDNINALPSHIIVIDRKTLNIIGKLWIPGSGRLKRPVLYSIINLESIFSSVDDDHSQ